MFSRRPETACSWWTRTPRAVPWNGPIWRPCILLNRCIARAHSTSDAREVLEGLGYDVLTTVVPRLEVYAQSFGLPVRQTGCQVGRQVARDLIGRCAPFCPVRS